ncbi:MAG: cadmium-translocating P-type ATPase [Alphaproteobacteria bacterium]|nr:cadmium-translocating P-type ATPase [Alphaproteobacteria bacterium]
MTECRHCGLPAPTATEFCCSGCEAAYALVRDQGLEQYYRRRCLDPTARALRPDAEAGPLDVSGQAVVGEDGIVTLHLMVEGLHCAACVWLIESLLGRQPAVVQARLNMTTRRLVLRWRGAAALGNDLIKPVLLVGYRVVPYDPARLGTETQRQEQELLRAMAVAGFASGNVMLFSVSLWAGASMGPATRSFLQWLSALVAVPAVIYCLRPFVRSALTALRVWRTNMDVPISLGVILTVAMSLYETFHGGRHSYFESALMLLFFLLVGRYLESLARGRARSAAEGLVALGAARVTVLEPEGGRRLLAPAEVKPGQTVLVATGERIGVDGTVSDGISELDTSLITGETAPYTVEPGCRVFAGTLNLTAPLRVVAGAVGEGTLLAEIVRLMEVAEQGRAHYVALADRVARLYAPVVHVMALLTFLGWRWGVGVPWQEALLTAVSVLIITCPCALALAVPVVQVIASGRLLRQGILLKSATALERLADVTTVVFDKTGTLTLGRPELRRDGRWQEDDLAVAASLAVASKHPLARALAGSVPAAHPLSGVVEVPGMGLQATEADGRRVRLGSRVWCGADGDDGQDQEAGQELWLARPGLPPVRFAFDDTLRPDAVSVVATLRQQGFAVELLSGDRAPTVARIAAEVGIDSRHATCSPADKVSRLQTLKADGATRCMVGDGLNDAPALATADVSMSPSSAVDVSQNVADVVFQGKFLAPVVEILTVARLAHVLVRQNFAAAFLYNIVTVPLAVMGYVTPLLAALAMSSSSLVVIVNALRLQRRRKP